jgi:hypothetical protein
MDFRGHAEILGFAARQSPPVRPTSLSRNAMIWKILSSARERRLRDKFPKRGKHRKLGPKNAKLQPRRSFLMSAANTSSSVVRFGTFEVNFQTGELRQKGQKVRLQEQPLQILAALLERPGEIVTREELRSRLWPEDTFVDFDHSLNAAIKIGPLTGRAFSLVGTIMIEKVRC